MKLLLYISIILFLIGCTKENYEISNLNGNTISSLGHAGMGISSTYPINSLESISKAVEIGTDGTELDVQLTKDNVLVAFHDEDLEGSTNLDGRIRSLNWSDISEGFYDVTPFTRYSIVKVEDLLNSFSKDNLIFTFDIKLYPAEGEEYFSYVNEFASRIATLFGQYNLYQNCFVESQSTDFIASLQTADPAIRQFIYPQSFDTGFTIAQNMNLFGITISTNNITDAEVEIAHDAGYWVTIWDVHTKAENREAIRKNPDMIQTDRVKYLTKQLK